MTAHATITFTQPGLQGPVYVVTDLSSPPWEPLEMQDSGKKTESGDPIFARHFEGDISEGRYQYKIRIGDGHWVLDTSKETAPDAAGNLNNIVHALSPTAPPPSTLESPTTQQSSETALERDGKKTRQDSIFYPANAPFAVADKVPNVEQPTDGDVESVKLPQNPAKHTADADPESKSVAAEPPVEPKDKDKKVEIPTFTVEKVDQNPAHGDDFDEGPNAAQQVARKLRAADAEIDGVLVNHGSVESYDHEFELAPRFSHEDGQSNSEFSSSSSPPWLGGKEFGKVADESVDKQDSSDEESDDAYSEMCRMYSDWHGVASTLDVIMEETEPVSSRSSSVTDSDCSSSEDDDFSDNGDDNRGDASLEMAPAFSHELASKDTAMNTPAETRIVDFAAEPLEVEETETEETEIETLSNQFGSDDAPLLPHEMDGHVTTDTSADDQAPLLSYERDFNDELEIAPMFLHEAGQSSTVELPNRLTNNGASHVEHVNESNHDIDLDESDDEMSELDRCPTLPYETNRFNGRSESGGLGSAPLLSHEAGTVDADDGNELERGFHFIHRHSFAHSKMDDYDESPSPTHEHHDDGIFLGGRHIRSGSSRKSSSSQRSSSFVDSHSSSPGFMRNIPKSSLYHGMRGPIAPGMPHSDAEDEDLKGTGYELFPTRSEEILAKLSGIARRLSMDDVSEGTLFDVKSHSSLASIREAAVPEEAEENESDGLSSREMGRHGIVSGTVVFATDGASGVDLASTSDKNTCSSLHTVNTSSTEATEIPNTINVPLTDSSSTDRPVDDRSLSSESFRGTDDRPVVKGAPNSLNLNAVSAPANPRLNEHRVSESGSATQDLRKDQQPQSEPDASVSADFVSEKDVQTQVPEEHQKKRGDHGLFGHQNHSRSLAALAVAVGLLWYWWA